MDFGGGGDLRAGFHRLVSGEARACGRSMAGRNLYRRGALVHGFDQLANPAVTVARMFTDTPAGIRPGDVPGFILGQAGGALIAFLFARWLEGSSPSA